MDKHLTPLQATRLTNNPDILLPDRPIAFNRDFVSIGCGVNGALMLSQALYWDKRTDNSDGWFYKTQEEWEEETGLTKEEQKTANRRLQSLGFLTIEKIGLPARNHYKVEKVSLVEALVLHKWGQKPLTGGGKSHSLSITETTTDIGDSLRSSHLVKKEEDITVVETDEDGNELSQRKKRTSLNQKKPSYMKLLAWSIGRRNGRMFASPEKQFKAFKMLEMAEISVDSAKERWQEFENDPFWIEKGFDWLNVVNSFDKRP